MATTRALLSDALLEIGAVGAEGSVPAWALQFGLRKLNRLIEHWRNNRLLTFEIRRATWTMVANQASYTVGDGGQVNIPRPVTMNMEGCNVAFIDTNSNPAIEIPLWPLTDDGYQAINQKTVAGTYPTSWYFNPTFTSEAAPFATLSFWPVPNVGYLQGVIYAPVAASALTLDTVLALPPGYEYFYVSQMAVQYCPAFQMEPSRQLLEQASESQAAIEKTNTRLQDLAVDLGLCPNRSRSNIYTGV